jgi:PD-(D/E)XK nuclease superfamily
VLEIPVSNQLLNSVIVLDNVPCFTLKEPRLIDILIRFRDCGQEYAIVLESKSHGAADQPGQIGEYLQHLTKAYPNSRKYLFYMKDGQPPSCSSITAEAWSLALANGICFAVDYHSLIKRWVDECSARSQPQRLKDFFNGFLKFTGVEQEPTMTVSKQTKDLVARLIESGSAKGEISAKLYALIELSVMTDFVWETAIKSCLKKVEAELKKQLPEWKMSLCSYLNDESRPRNEFELDLWKAQWKEANKEDAVVSVFLATWRTSFSIGWFKREPIRHNDRYKHQIMDRQPTLVQRPVRQCP